MSGGVVEGRSLAEIDATALSNAVDAEASFYRNFLPAEPFWPSIVQHRTQFADALHREVERGRVWPAGHVVDVRKPGHGVRPIAILPPEARVFFRTLADACVPSDSRPDRTSDSYAEFVVAPILSGFSRLPEGPTQIGNSRFKYVVMSDVAAFYQYIDHELLRSELDLLGAPIGPVDSLLDLLSEIQQRTFGIPQRSEPSDWLSEVYALRLDRWLARQGLEHWRFNDDFRIGCSTYGDALQAIEILSAAARDSGLVLNDEKTAAPRFLTYLINYSNVEVHAPSDEIDPADVEAAVLTSEYAPEDDDQARDDAQAVIDRLTVSGARSGSNGEQINLADLSQEDHRSIRRAINTLTRLEDGYAVAALQTLLAFQPAMTHLVLRYVERIAPTTDEVHAVLDSAATELALTDWQRAWIAYGYRVCNTPIHGERHEWLANLATRDVASYASAEATVTLANAERLSFPFVEDRIRRAPTALVPWYCVATAAMKAQGLVSSAAAGALQTVSPTARALLS